MVMLKGFIRSTPGQEHFSLYQCVICYFNQRFIFILLFGESFFSSGTCRRGFYGTLSPCNHREFGVPEGLFVCLFVFCFSKKNTVFFLMHYVRGESSPVPPLSAQFLALVVYMFIFP